MHRNAGPTPGQSPRRGRPRDRRAEDAILDAALALFGEGGLASTTFDGVARRAGVSRSTIYRRWSTRDELLTAALKSRRARAEAGLEDWATRPHDEVMEIFEQLAARSLTDPDDTGLLRQVTALPQDSAVRQAYWSTIVEPRRAAYADVLTAARRNGDLPPGPDTDLVLDQLAGALTYRALVNPEPLTEDTAVTYVRRLLQSLGLRPPRCGTTVG